MGYFDIELLPFSACLASVKVNELMDFLKKKESIACAFVCLLSAVLLPTPINGVLAAVLGGISVYLFRKDQFTHSNNLITLLKLTSLKADATTGDDLSAALEKVVHRALKILPAQSAELSLIDQETGQYHSAFSLGVPIQRANQNLSHDISLRFADSELGRIRISLKRALTKEEIQYSEILAVQGTVALLLAEYTKELLKVKTISEESLRAKTGFLANLSHEIRGPLGIIMNAVDLVHGGHCGPLTQEQKEPLEMVLSNGKHLLSLINDVLDFAKVEAGRLTANPVVLELKEAVEDVVTLLRSQAHSKKHKLTVGSIPGDAKILCDNRHFRQVFINLLTNAIKYTPEGGTIHVSAEVGRGHRAIIHVKDSGVGIKEEDRDKVFAAFERLDDGYSSKQLGTGLGLSLTKKLVELNGGSIDFYSTPSKGSDFYFSLPLTDQSVSRPEQNTDSSVIKGVGRGVLIAALDQSSTKTITRYLARLGFKLAFGTSMQEIESILSTEPIEIILVDNPWLAEMGDDVIKGIRRNPIGARLPIVLLSNRAFSFDVEEFLKRGIDRCISQPVELHEIALVIDNLTRRRSGEVGRIIGELRGV